MEGEHIIAIGSEQDYLRTASHIDDIWPGRTAEPFIVTFLWSDVRVLCFWDYHSQADESTSIR